MNYVVGYVQHEGIEMLLDATSENISPGILPEYCMNGQGLLVKKDNEQWLTLVRNNKEIKKQFITINIDKDGNARAKINQELSGYGFLTWSETQKAQNYDAELYKNKLQEEFPEIDILSYSVNSKDVNTRKSKETIEVDFTNQLVDFGEGVFFTPFLMFEYAKNTFKSEDRKYPVDLIFPKELNTTIVVNLPKEFSIKKLPESIKYTNTDGSAIFTYMAQGGDLGLQFKTTLNLNRSVFTETEYLDLRRFFSEVSKKISSPLELTRKKT